MSSDTSTGPAAGTADAADGGDARGAGSPAAAAVTVPDDRTDRIPLVAPAPARPSPRPRPRPGRPATGRPAPSSLAASRPSPVPRSTSAASRPSPGASRPSPSPSPSPSVASRPSPGPRPSPVPRPRFSDRTVPFSPAPPGAAPRPGSHRSRPAALAPGGASAPEPVTVRLPVAGLAAGAGGATGETAHATSSGGASSGPLWLYRPGWFAGRTVPWWAEALGLLLAPLLAALVLRTPPMSVGLASRWTMVDPNFYTAYATHGADLVQRFGADDYFWVRLGQILPAHLAWLAFGNVGGFVVLRYVFALIATVPAYLWLRPRSRATGALAVAVVLTSPVVLMAWGSDYPDGAALAYLLAGLPLLVMPATGRRRVVLRGLAGFALGFAVHAHPAAFPLVAAALLAVAGTAFSRHTGLRRARTRRVAVDLGAVVAGVLAASVVVVAAAWSLYGRADVLGPTIDQLTRLQRPDQIRLWHSSTWAWAERATYLLVPPVVVVGWVTLRVTRCRRGGQRPPRDEAVVVAATGLGFLAYLLIQAGDGFTLEYYLYSSLLWAPTTLVTALLLAELVPARSVAWRWWPVGVVVGLAVLGSFLPVARFGTFTVGLLLAAVVVGAVVLVARAGQGAGSGRPGVRGVAVAGLVVAAGAQALTVGQPSTPYATGQVHYPQVDYGGVTGAPDTTRLAAYDVMASLPDVVPPASGVGEQVLTWVEPPAAGSLPDEVPSRAAAQYLGPAHGLQSRMPDLSASDRRRLDGARRGLVVLLGADGAGFDAAQQALAPWSPTVERTAVLGSGPTTLHVMVLRLGG